MSMASAVTDENFEGEIEKHAGLAVVDFWAAWCGPCRIIAPILDSLAISPIAVGLAIASGAMIALQDNSNFFWMFKSLLGLSTKGTLKTLTLVTSVASVVSLPLVMLAAVVL